MQDLYPDNYRIKDIEEIVDFIERKQKVNIQYLNDVGKNAFIKRLVFISKNKLPDIDLFDYYCLADYQDFKKSLYAHISQNNKLESTFSEIRKYIEAKYHSQRLVINLQFDYLDLENDQQLQILELVSKLRSLNPDRVILLLHYYWKHDLAKELANSKLSSLFNGIKTIHSAFTRDNFDQALFYFQKRNRLLDSKEKDVLWKISGGIPRLYKQAYIYSIENSIDLLDKKFISKFNHSDRFKNYINTLLVDLGEELTSVLSSIVDADIKQIAILEELGIINQDKKIKSESINYTISNYLKGNTSLVDLTPTELSIYNLIKKKEGLTSREDVAKAIWGDQYLDSYSDYTIDKHISNLRKKLSQLHKGKIITKKGRGFIFSF